MTGNAPEGYYRELLERYRQTLSGFASPMEVFVCGDTLQRKNYSKKKVQNRKEKRKSFTT